MAVPAQVVKLLERSGHRGVRKVRCKVLEGEEKGKILVRNVSGPVRENDILMLEEVEMESN